MSGLHPNVPFALLMSSAICILTFPWTFPWLKAGSSRGTLMPIPLKLILMLFVKLSKVGPSIGRTKPGTYMKPQDLIVLPYDAVRRCLIGDEGGSQHTWRTRLPRRFQRPLSGALASVPLPY